MIGKKNNKDRAISYILHLLYWDQELGDWDPYADRAWNGYDELLDINSILIDQGLVPKPGVQYDA